MRIQLVGLALCTVLLGGCVGSFWQLFWSAGDPTSVADATPPPGYNPDFIIGTAPYTGAERSAHLSVDRVLLVDTMRVQLAVHVVDSGRHLTGAGAGDRLDRWCLVADSIDGDLRVLQEGQFEVAEEHTDAPVALALVLDHSGSMGAARAVLLQRAVNDLIDDKRPSDGIAVTRFDSRAVTERTLSRDAEHVLENGLRDFGGGTAIWDGVAQGLEELADSTTRASFERRAVVLFTDGSDNSSTIPMESLIPRARAAGVQVFTVGFGLNISEADERRLQHLAGLTGGRYYKIYRRGEFASLFRDIYQRYTAYYQIALTLPVRGIHVLALRLCNGQDSLLACAVVDNRPTQTELAVTAPAYMPPPIAYVRLASPSRYEDERPTALAPPLFTPEHVLFHKASAKWLPGAPEKLNAIADYMLNHPYLRATVEGHTSNTMGASHDVLIKLSEDRARAVARHLVGRGVAVDRLSPVGYGPDRPVVAQRPDSIAARNRRVVVKVEG